MLVVCALLAVAVAVLLQDTSRTNAPLDPDNPGAQGTRALSRVAADDVEVRTARDADALAALRPGEGDTVVVTAPSSLGASTVERLQKDAAGATVVLLEPDHTVLGLFGLPDESYAAGADVVGADCTDGRFADLEIRVDAGRAYPGPGCFPTEHGFLLAEPRDGLVLLGASSALTNDQVLGSDNAALGLRLVGSGDRLVWYVPDPADLTASDAVPLSALLPPSLGPGLLVVAAALLALVLWRGRRFGPLSVEPLPVTVRATESTRSRGRLYHRAHDRAHAATALRTALLADAARHLGLGAATPGTVAEAVAARTGRHLDEVATLLLDPAPPATDAALTQLATDLATLDREVRTT